MADLLISEISPKLIDLASPLFAVCAAASCGNAATAKNKVKTKMIPYHDLALE